MAQEPKTRRGAVTGASTFPHSHTPTVRLRSILCVQLKHFYARVACLQAGGAAPPARVAVTQNGRVLDSSPEAEAAGLRPGMRVREARRWFPDALFAPANEEIYPDYARPVLEICASYTPLVDPETPARIFLDVAGCEALYGPPEEIAGQLARRIPRETGFACTVGGGRSRLVAALAAPYRRLVPPGEEREFLAPLPLRLLGEMIPREMAEWLEVRGVSTFGEVAALPQGALWRRFGLEGEKLIHLAAGLDPTPVRPAYPPRTVDTRVDCESPPQTEEEAAQYLAHLAFDVAGRLKETHDTARRYRLRLSFRDGSTTQDSLRLPAPIGTHGPIYQVLLRLFRRLAPPEPPVELAATAEEITPGEAFQASLFPELEEAPGRGDGVSRRPSAQERERERRLSHVLGLLAVRYGPMVAAPGCHLWVTRRPRFIDRLTRGEW